MAFKTNQIQVDGSINIDGSIFQWNLPFTGGGNQWLTNGTALYYNNGNVGIGTNVPPQVLSIKALDSDDGLVIISLDDIAVVTANSTLSQGGSLTIDDSLGATKAKIRGYASGNVQAYFTAGNIGLGTSNPSTLLHLYSTGSTTPRFKVSGPGEQTWQLYNESPTGATTTSLKFASRNNPDWSWIWVTDDANNGQNDFMLYNREGGVKYVIYCASNGNIILGDTNTPDYNPASRLSVIGDVSIAGNLRISGGDLYATDNQSSLRLTGTTTGSSWGAAVEVVSSSNIRARGMFYKTDDSAAEWFSGVPYNQGTTWAIGYDPTGGQSEYSASTLLILDTNGNVTIDGGIKASSATIANDVSISGNTYIKSTIKPQVLITSDGANGLFLRADSASSHYNWLIAEQNNISATLEITPSTTVGGTTFSTPAFLVYQTGAIKAAGSITATLPSSVQSNVVYYNSGTGEMTYGAAPGGGDISTLSIESYVNPSSYYDGSLYRVFPNPSTGLSNYEARGTWITLTAGEAITAFYAVSIAEDGKVYMADADSSTTGMPAIALAAAGAVSSGAEGKFLLNGVVYNSAWNWTPGRQVYLYASIDGYLWQTPPSSAGQCVQVLGIATSPDSMLWNPSPDFMVIK